MPDDLDGGEHGADIQNALAYQRHAEQDHQRLPALGGAEHEHQSAQSADSGGCHDQPPEPDAEGACLPRHAHPEQSVRKDVQSQRHAQDGKQSAGAEQNRRAQRDEQRTEDAVILKRQPVQILGKESDQLDDAKQDHQTAAQASQRHGGGFRPHDEDRAQRAHCDRQNDVPDLCHPHGGYRTGFHGKTPPFRRSGRCIPALSGFRVTVYSMSAKKKIDKSRGAAAFLGNASGLSKGMPGSGHGSRLPWQNIHGMFQNA